ncbi:PREDICTED: protein LNK3 isoform X2 [Camelina sativa]|uniref:Protein LNK3 isoform X2 n=1 Tax=Camelina sativa TaxID=90675 RepID=A0ABM0XJL6_CAMSA|nr:PREDICTED: protein LNK3 isoform X2 [Camelina sativa]
MDCYAGRNFEELVVPSYQESSSETYPSTGMWGGWSMSSPQAAQKCFDYDGFNGEGLMYSQMGMRTSEEEEESKRSKANYGASSLHDFEGIEHMDDMFFSILEDVPEDDGDVHRATSSNNSVGSSSMYGGREVPMFHCHDDMSFKEEAPFTISDLYEDNNMLDSNYGDELSSEELVLQDLQRASQKLTDETRKCFRDTFYRLARSSQDKSDSVSTNSEELLMQTSRYDYGDGNRLSREEEIESETNSIDRAIANLTFNKMESNISNYPLPERVQ